MSNKNFFFIILWAVELDSFDLIKNVFNDLNTYETHQKLQYDLSITLYHAPSKSPSHSGVIEGSVSTIKKSSIKTL